MFCPRCGLSMPENAQFCANCGTQTAVAASGSAPVGAAPQQAMAPAQAVYVPAVAVAQQAPTENMAVISMVLGILSLVALSVLAGIPAIILGKQSRENIRASKGALTGDSMAQAGIIMGWVSVALFIIGAVVVIGLIFFGLFVASHSR